MSILRHRPVNTIGSEVHSCSFHLFEAQVKNSPDSVAVVYRDENLTYSELDSRANQLAHYLIKLGVGPDVLVGICADRGIESLVGILGVLKAGGAYLPLDPEYPQQRLSFILTDTEVSVLLTQNTFLELISRLDTQAHAPQVVCLDTDWVSISAESTASTGTSATDNNLAYVIYTSGSTGEPKGVLIERRGLCNMAEAQLQAFSLQSGDHVLQFSSLSFDASVFEIFMALHAGATLVIAPPESRVPGPTLTKLLRDQEISIVTLPPSVLAALPRDDLPKLKIVTVAGEACSAELVERWAQGRRFFNLYGPTEATVWATVAECVDGSKKPSIGQAILNTRTYLLDADLQPVSPGETGELHIAGAGLARGYLNRPELSAEKFIPDPFQSDPGARMYRTGDIGRLLPDGNIEFIGRKDDQVKLRGFRIELGEVEAKLRSHPGVRDAVVTLMQGTSGDQQLVAHVVADNEGWQKSVSDRVNLTDASSAFSKVPELREYLEQTLPHYMVPAAFVLMDALPLTIQGKVDRRALPAPGADRSQLSSDYVAPCTPFERTLATIWERVLKIDRVGVNDNFFELGGDSLLGAVLINALQKELDLGAQLYIVTLFDAPTVAGQAHYLKKHFPNDVTADTDDGQQLSAEQSGSAAGSSQAIVDSLGSDEIDDFRNHAAAWHRAGDRLVKWAQPRNPRMCFILTPPRSGSSLLRIMLAGHQQLFAPPELELLSFDSMQQRHSSLSGRLGFMREGLVRALMDIRQCDSTQAENIIVEHEARGDSVQVFYRLLQEWIGDRLLVEKSTTYSLSPEVLAHAEEGFEGNLYIHLVRHPYGTIRSFEEARLDTVLNFAGEHDYSITQFAELTWMVSHQNILSFLSNVPAHRQLRIQFEELVKNPRPITESICSLLNVEFDPLMLEPYQHQEQRMTDGSNALSVGMSDPKFHSHKNINPGIADRWKNYYSKDFLTNDTWQLAEDLGYKRITLDAAATESVSTDQAVAVIERVPRDAGNPPIQSYSQQRLWFMDRLAPGNPGYNTNRVIQLDGYLDATVLERSLEAIINRHEVCRTNYEMNHGQPVQIIHPEQSFTLQRIDLGNLKAEEKQSRIERIIHAETMHAFDLARDPLCRAVLIHLSDQHHILIFSIHHILSDAWSRAVIHKELSILYDAFLDGQPSPLQEMPIQYADYAVWQRRYLSGSEGERLKKYWLEEMRDAPRMLELPTDRLRPSVQTHEGANKTIRLHDELVQQLTALSRQEGVTLFMTILAAFNILLGRYSRQSDIVVGIPVSGRNRAEFEVMIGEFINIVPIRSRLSSSMTFRDLVSQVRETSLSAFEHQDYPFDLLVSGLNLERSLDHHPLFQVMFAFHQPLLQDLDLRDLQCTSLNIGPIPMPYDMTVIAIDEPDGLDIAIDYNIDLFDADTIDRMAEHFICLLESIAAGPERQLHQLSIMTAAERQQLVSGWNSTTSEYPFDKCVHKLFEEQTMCNPDAQAVLYGNEQLTYRQLNQRSNQLAHYLLKRGVRSGDLVGLFVERSLDMVVGILAVLKAGGAYVPLDLDYPQARLAYMLDDAGTTHLLTQSSLQSRLPELPREVICLDTDWETIEQQPVDNLDTKTTADSLIYVIYTSGTTGQPKGVAVPHHAVNRLVCNTDYFQVEAEDRVAQASNVSFDAATFEIWGALLNGARLVGISKDVLLNPKKLSACLSEQGITTMFMTTALFNLMSKEDPTAFSGLRGLMFGGEAVDPEAVRRVLLHGPPERLLHVYGPTESTTFASWCRVEEVAAEARTVPIGKPIANTRLYVLDETRQPVPIGITGELYIGGDGLAQGYLNRPQLTSEKFVDDPFSNDPDGRLYKTGDLVRYKPDGNIEFLGRIDHQVKLRGFRIELGEIEAAMSNHASIQDAIVMVREDAPGDRRLVAYTVPAPTPTPTQQLNVELLRSALEDTLPAYMVPAVFVVLTELPLTPNGKVDRDALPIPEVDSYESESDYAPPRTSVEEQLVEIWRSVLKLERIGVNDNFFNLGGHSLMATQVASRIYEQFGVELPLTELFTHTTIVELLQVVEARRMESDTSATAMAIHAVQRDGHLPVSFAQQRLWFLDQLEPGSVAYNIPITVRLTGELNRMALHQSLQEIVNRHESLRTSFGVHEGQPFQDVSVKMALDLPIEDLRILPQQERPAALERWIDQEALQSFDLTTGNMLRARLLQVDNDVHVLVMVMHHIASDGWSLGVMFRELGALYAAYNQERPSPLPELRVQYVDYASWQRQWLSGGVLEQQLNYWKQRLAHAEVMELPLDKPRPAVQSVAGAREVLQLSTELTEALEALGQQEGTTLFMTMLAAFSILLNRYCRQDDIVVGSPIANRHHAEVEDLIGFFVNTLVLRMDLSGEPAFRELLHQVKEIALGAYEHQDLPFEMLVDELSPERDRSRNPLFQVLFALQNAPFSELSLEGLTLERLPSVTQTTRFDLEAHLWPGSNGLMINIVFNTDLFEADTIRQMLGHYQTLLEGVVNNANSRVGELDLLTEREQRLVVDEWNRTQTSYTGKTGTIHESFEAQAERKPNAIALEFGDERLTYRMLNAQANRLAHYLQARGVGPEVLVGLCLERGLEAAVAVLAVLKAGAGYVPLDPAFPHERLKYMLEDAQLAVLVTRSNLVERLPSNTAEIVCLDDAARPWSECSTRNPEHTVQASQPAYVMFTSGSTGRPKGIVMTHAVLNNLIAWQINRSDDVGRGRTLHFASLSFDVSFQEMFSSWCAGGTLVAISEELRHDPAGLLDFLCEARIERLFMPFAGLNQLAETAVSSKHLPETLREVITAGEALQITPAIERMFAGLGGCTLDNQYGPSESHVVTACCLEGDPGQWPRLPSIGRPIANATIYLLDDRLRPVPVGVPGEIHIGGKCLARGYIGRPELTEEKFIPDPFINEAEARMYRTGDLARYRADGSIEFLGRVDTQVKLRGYRVELGDIEVALMEHPGIRESVAMLREDRPGDRRLVAYYVAAGDLDAAELRTFMKNKLPEYMSPAVFMELDSLPLTPSGKVNRLALPAPVGMRQVSAEYVAPRSELETRLMEIWQEVLDVEHIGIHDNFFELGGHSLMATRVMGRLHDELHVKVPVAELFDYTTIAELAEKIDMIRWMGEELVANEAGDREEASI